MIRIALNPGAIDQRQIGRVAAVLASGGLIVYPTDTFYGLGADPRNADAVRKLFAAKGRAGDQASPLIAATLQQAEDAVEFNDVARRLADCFWPGPLSLVLTAREQIQRAVIGGGTTAAIRVPAHPVARELARAADFCITATSANISGSPPSQSPSDISPELLAQVDALVDSGETRGGAPSTLVDVTADTPRLVRAGAIAWNRVLESLQ